jgi:hypothetical protein
MICHGEVRVSGCVVYVISHINIIVVSENIATPCPLGNCPFWSLAKDTILHQIVTGVISEPERV